MNYLDFEKPIAELIEQLEKIKQVGVKNGVDVVKGTAEIEEKIKAVQEDEYKVMQQNVLVTGKQIRNGFYLNQVFN